jgi:hypothetical protein
MSQNNNRITSRRPKGDIRSPVGFVLCAVLCVVIAKYLLSSNINSIAINMAEAVRTALKVDGSFAIINWHKRPREETPILREPRGPKTELRMSPEETIKAIGT